MSIDKVSQEEWDRVTTIKKDMVNKPPHYQGKIECIDLIKIELVLVTFQLT